MLARVREGFAEKEMFELSFKGLKGLVFQEDQRGLGLPKEVAQHRQRHGGL